MPYPKKLLNDYETVALDLHPHWWFFAKALLAHSSASIIFGILVLDRHSTARLETYAPVGGDRRHRRVASSGSIRRYAIWSTTNFVDHERPRDLPIGCRRASSGIEIPLERVNNVLFNQSVFERMLGAGDLLIESGGESGQQRFTDIRTRRGSRT